MKGANSILKVKPCNDNSMEQLKTVFEQNYCGCRVDLENIRTVPHGGYNSELTLVDVVVSDSLDGAITTVSALVKTLNDKNKKSGLAFRCHWTRFMTREVVFYTKILPSIFQDNFGNETLSKIVPKCFFGFTNHSSSNRYTSCCIPWISSVSKSDEAGILVLEDLTKREGQHITSLNKNEYLDYDHVQVALVSLAHIHGCAWRWFNINKANRYQSRILKSIHSDNWFLSFCFKTIFKLIRKMLITFLQNRKENPDLIEKLDNFMKNEAFDVLNDVWSNNHKTKFDTLVHGDFWAANILFGYTKERLPNQALVVDFQQVGIGNPMRDIISLIYTSTTSSFRYKHFNSLLKTYYSQFQRYFAGYFFMTPCSYEVFYQQFLKHRKFGFVWGLYIVCVVLLPDTRGRTVWDNSELSVKDVLKRRFAKIASNDPHVSSNYAEIRTRLLDLIKEARSVNII